MTTTNVSHADDPAAAPETTAKTAQAADRLVEPGALGAMLAPVRGKLVLGVVLSALSVPCGALSYIALIEIGRVLLTGGAAASAWTWAAVAAAGAMLRLLLNGSSVSMCHYADADFRHAIRARLARHLATVSLGWFDGGGSGEVKQAASDDIKRMHMIVAHHAADVTSAVLAPLVALVYLVVVDWRYALLFVGYILLAVLIATPAMVRGYRQNADEWNHSMHTLTAATVELADGAEVIKAYGPAARAFSRYADAVERVVRVCVVWTAALGRPTTVMSIMFAPASMIVALLAIGLPLLSAGWVEPVDVLAFLVMGIGIPTSALHVGSMTHINREAQLGATHLQRVLEVPPLPEPAEPGTSHGHRVEFDRVRFSYDGEHDVLHDVSLTLEPGTVTALVGPSGSGKTTLARLLPRFWDVTGGAIRIGGADVRAQPTGQVLAQMAIVFQDVVLLRDTVRENIRLGRADAGQAEIEQAARRAQVHDVIMALPGGYDTVLGEGAGELSGGERQRLTIARAILRNPPIVLLDEATAHADPHSEAAIQQAIGELAAGSTMLVIAHRLHTVARADQIVVLDGGRVVERGRHDDLVAAGGLYAQMWAAQQPVTARAGGPAGGSETGEAAR